MWKAFIKFWFLRDLYSWRSLRRACLKALPKVDRKSEIEVHLEYLARQKSEGKP